MRAFFFSGPAGRTRPVLTAVVFVATALWHALAAWHFTLFPERTLKRTTRERPVNPFATELFRFLGGLNLALTVLALASLRVPASAQWACALALMVGNASQFVVDVRVRRLRLADGAMFWQIYIGDGLFTLANALVLARAIL